MVYYGNQRQLEYDFVVAPGADPKRIELSFEGAEQMRIDERGDLVLRVAGGEIRQHKPVVYQEVAGVRKEIAGSYVIKGKQQVGFELGSYDESLPLVIDPTLVYSTFLGGSSDDGGGGIALDSAGNAYVVGSTQSANFPTTGSAHDTTFDAPVNAFVTKLNPAGTALVYSTYFGSNTDGDGIAVDGSGQAYITGGTGVNIIPIVNGFQTVHGGAVGTADAYVAKFNSTGSTVLYSSYIGGGGNDRGNAIAADNAGNAYVTGFNNSGNSFPTTANAFQQFFPDNACGGGTFDGFVTKVNTNAVGAFSLIYSTHLAGSGTDGGNAIAVDSAGNAYVTGATNSSNFPTANPFQAVKGSGYDAFVAKIANVVSVTIDIKPGSFPNSINPKSQGVIPVAILTTATFNATTVDTSTVHFGKTGTEASPVQVALEDVDGDGDTDMILHFNTQGTGIVCGTTSASLTGKTIDGQPIQGTDSVNTVGCK